MPAKVQEAFPDGPTTEETSIEKCANEICPNQTVDKCVRCSVHFCSKRCMVIGFENHLRNCVSVPPHTRDAPAYPSRPNRNSYQQQMRAPSTVNNRSTPTIRDNRFVADGDNVSAEVIKTPMKSKIPTKVTKNSDNKGHEQSTKINRRSFGSNKNASPNKFNDNGHSDQKFKQRSVTYLKVGAIFKMRILELGIYDRDGRKDMISLKVIDDEPIYQNFYDTLAANVIDVEVATLEKKGNYICQKDGKWVRVFVLNIYDNDVFVSYPDLETAATCKVPKNIFREYPSQCENFPPATKRAHFVDDTSEEVLRECCNKGTILKVKVVKMNGRALALKLLEIGEKSHTWSDMKQVNCGCDFKKENFGTDKLTPPYDKAQKRSKKPEEDFDQWDRLNDFGEIPSRDPIQSSNRNISVKRAGEEHLIIVTALCPEDSSCFYVANDPSVMDTIDEELATINPLQFRDLTTPRIGDECLSIYEEQWYRGIVVKLYPTEVFYVDYGNKEIVDTLLKEIPQFLAMNRLPSQAKKIKLEAGNVVQWGIDFYSEVNIKIVRHEDEFIVCSVGEIKKVMVMYSHHEEDDKIHVVLEEDVDKLTEISELPRIPLENTPSIGMLILLDFDNILCRALIVKTDPLFVEFIDYGSATEIECDYMEDLFQLLRPWSEKPPLSFLVPIVEGIEGGKYYDIIKKIGHDDWQFLL